MAGTPTLHAMAQAIELAGGIDHICERIADGESMGEIASSFGVSRPLLYKWIGQDKDARMKKINAARELSAEAHVEKGLEILDELEHSMLTPAQVAAAKARADYRKWLAGMRDREQFGEKKGGDVVVNLGSLHLEALVKGGSAAAALPEPEPEPELLEAEVIDDEGEG